MNELTLDGKTYVSSKRAAELTGYAKDYVGQLCREGHVEARLVGRNWYVLESSIREHRFGKKEEEATSKPVDTSTWEASRYEPEFPSYIAPISPREETVIEKEKEADEIPSHARPAILSDMQSAWQEWFENKKEIQPETLEEVVVDETVIEPESVPVALHTLTSREEDQESVEEVEEEMIPSAVYSAQKPLDLSRVVRHEPEVEGRVEEEGYSEEKVRGLGAVSNLILRSVFVGIAILSIAITAVGTGIYTRFTGTSGYRLSEINLISGVSVYNR